MMNPTNAITAQNNKLYITSTCGLLNLRQVAWTLLRPGYHHMTRALKNRPQWAATFRRRSAAVGLRAREHELFLKTSPR
jgi:hypothetical protein